MTENPKKSTEKVIETNEFSKVVGYKINTQKSVVYLYAKVSLKRIKLRNHFIYNCSQINK